MKSKSYNGQVIPINRDNVDTDLIIPKQYLKSIKKSGFGAFLFDSLRYNDTATLDSNDEREENSEFILNRDCLLYTSPSPRDRTRSRMPSSA